MWSPGIRRNNGPTCEMVGVKRRRSTEISELPLFCGRRKTNERQLKRKRSTKGKISDIITVEQSHSCTKVHKQANKKIKVVRVLVKIECGSLFGRK